MSAVSSASSDRCLVIIKSPWIYSDSLHTTHYSSYVNLSNCLSRLVVKRTMRMTKAVDGRLGCAGSIRAKKSPSLYSVKLSLDWVCRVEVSRSLTNSTLSFWYSFSRSLDVSCNSWTLRRSNSRSLSNSVHKTRRMSCHLGRTILYLRLCSQED